jgi:Carboxypeptidase regulatory-like domain/TonB dependent receptor-like, beta-barrel/TonB-dependent Receptor Plug Domain
MRDLVRFLVIGIFLIAGAGVALGQGTTATLAGTVTSGGTALPGVLVTVSSPALQGTRSAATGSSGSYSIAGLPPGDYTVTFELAGMQTKTQRARLILAQTTRADEELSVSGVKEEVSVKGEAEAVLETTQIATNFTSEEISRLPVARTIVQTVLLAPGVSNTGVNNQVTISGAPSYDNTFLVNGVVVNENLRGQPHNLFIEDAIQETTVLSGGVSAEYGRFTGGVVSTLTKSGGNTFSGSFRDSLSNPKWTEKTPWPAEADHVDKTDSVYEATLGGRILKDHLWFFGAGRLAKRSLQRFTAITNLPFTNAFDEKRWEGKLTGQIATGHNLVVSYLNIKNDESNNFFGNILDYDSLVPTRSLPNTLLAVNYNGVLTKNLIVEAQYANKKFTFENSGGLLTDRIGGTLLVDTNGRRFHAPTFCGVCSFEERNNDSWLGKATYYLDTPRLGSHSIVLGAENFAEERLANNHQEGSDFRISSVTSIIAGTTVYPRFGSASVIQYQPILENSTGTDFQTFSAFVNDKWDFNRHFSFNVGLRYDKNNGKDASGNKVSDDSAFSPRLGLAWDIQGTGRARATATYARYVSKIADGNVGGGGQAAGNPANITWLYGGPEINPASSCSPTNTAGCLSSSAALEQLFAWFDSVGGINYSNLNSTSVPGFSAVFPKSLVSPSVDEFTLGYGTQIGTNAYAKVDLIARDWNNFYNQRIDLSTPQATDPFGNRGDVAFIENNDSAIERKYRGVQFQGQWRPGRFMLGVTYTWSRLTGNDDGEGAGTATSPNTAIGTFYPEYLDYEERKPTGYLGQDIRHRARLAVGYELPTRFGTFDATVLQSYDSGLPYSAFQNIDASGRSTPFPGSPVNPGYTLSQLGTTHTYYFSKRGEFRADDVNSTDISLGYSIRVFKSLELFLRGYLFNVFDNNPVVFPDTTVITRRSGGAGSNLVAFNPLTDTPIECTQRDPNNSSRCAVSGANWMKGTLFGQPNGVGSYYNTGGGLQPRTYGFTAGFRF